MLQFSMRKNFLAALGLTALLLASLLVLCIIQQEKTAKIVILAGLMVPIVGLFAESWRRKILFTDDEIIAQRVFRQKTIKFAEVTSVDTVRVRRRIFVSVSSEADFLIMSNNYEDFGELLSQLIAHAPEATISEETRLLANNLPTKNNDLFSLGLAIVVLLLILYVQLGGSF